MAAWAGLRALGALPLRWLPFLASGWAWAGWRGHRRRTALANWGLVFGDPGLGERERDMPLVAEARQRLAQLTAWHARDGTVGRLRRELAERVGDAGRPGAEPLLLTARLGAGALARALLRRRRGPHLDLDELPRAQADALWLPWLGRITAVRRRAVEHALTGGRPVRLLLVLPDAAGRPRVWLSPDLAAPRPSESPRTAESLLAAALAALEVLVRAVPHERDWSWPRWRLRPEPPVAGHAPYSRWAPWLTPKRRARRPGSPAR